MDNSSLNIIKNSLQARIEKELQRIGILCRVFARVKDDASLQEKITRKMEANPGQPYYTKDGKKVQDIVGIRIVTYFYEDVDILWDVFSKMFTVVDTSIAEVQENNFEPLRKNMVCLMPKEEKQTLEEYQASFPGSIYELIDSTFEIQFRTILSEGWHEVDHMLRYKSKEDWKELKSESRMFNGIYATLETSDKALKALFDDIAHRHYKDKKWSAMLRFKYKMHFVKGDLSSNIVDVLNSDLGFAKYIYMYDRHELVKFIALSKLKMRLTLDNLVFVIYLRVEDYQNPQLDQMIPQNVRDDILNSIGRQ